MSIIYPNLYKKLSEKGISFENLGDMLGVSTEDVCNKMSGMLPWSLAEAVSICKLLHTSDVKKLFVQLDSNT